MRSPVMSSTNCEMEYFLVVLSTTLWPQETKGYLVSASAFLTIAMARLTIIEVRTGSNICCGSVKSDKHIEYGHNPPVNKHRFDVFNQFLEKKKKTKFDRH